MGTVKLDCRSDRVNKKAISTNEMITNVIQNSSLCDDLTRHFYYTLGRDEVESNHRYLYQALALTLRDRLVAKLRETAVQREQSETKQVAYISLEFLMGRALQNAALNLDLETQIKHALTHYGVELETLLSAEHDAGLGNGGLGRLAACFLDSCATLGLPVTGYGLRYEYGMFKQQIENNQQLEQPDHWLHEGHPWEIPAPEQSQHVKFFGHVEVHKDKHGREHRVWCNTQDILAVPFDVPIPGYKNETVNCLRLWKSEATDEFNLTEFNAGSYTEAVSQKNQAEQITMVLYPNDASENGKELRLRQQYFLTSATLQDILAKWVAKHGQSFSNFEKYHVFQLNDTHPSIAVAELMRLLVDEYELEWQRAWQITTSTMAYTNHTLLPEALEKWSVPLFEKLLPRLLEIIYEINARFLQLVAIRWPGDCQKQRALSIIEEGDVSHIRMAYLAIIGSYSVNGVAALHTQLLSDGLFHDFYLLWPEKFNNKTNGVTPRRWLHHSNRALGDVISQYIGSNWVQNYSQISQLQSHISDSKLQTQWQQIKRQNKQQLITLVKHECDVEFDASMMFDVQVKRIHEYKRQLLNVLHIIHLYERIRHNEIDNLTPRCILIGGKAAPGYAMAKLIIRLINHVASAINADPLAAPYLRVAFLPNYNVSAMEVICPATDLSEQISTSGKEASGTGNMKFMMNGALTIGTLDGANIEILDAVGHDNFFLFGAKSHEIDNIRASYQPNQIIQQSKYLSRVMALLESGHFNLFNPGLFQPIIDAIRDPHDQWLTAYDFDDYVKAQERAATCYQNQAQWTQMSLLNTACSGAFSSDRTISQYDQDIWHTTSSCENAEQHREANHA